MNRIIFALTLFCVFSTIPAKAQTHHRLPDADSLYQKAREAAFSDRWPESRKIARELLRYYPEYNDARILIGRTYAWELKADSARMIVMPILDTEPDSYDVYSLLSDSEIWAENYDEALEILERALRYEPTNQEYLFKRANAYYLKGDYENAIIAVEALLDVNPNHPAGLELQKMVLTPVVAELYQKADIEAGKGNYDEARKLLRELLVDEPGHFPALLLIAQTYAFENKFDSARHVTAELYREEPEHYDLLMLMVNVEVWDNKYKDGMKQVDIALTAHPDTADFLYKKALIQFLQKDYNASLATLDHVLDNIDPKHADSIRLRNEILQNYRYRDYALLENYFEYAKHREGGYYTRKWITSGGLAKWTKYGTYIGKLNVGHDWGQDHRNLMAATRLLPAYQLEFEAYQNLWRTNYLWLNHAFALDSSGFFPRHRGGAEFFQRIPENFEASLGFRYMHWDKTTWVVTGSLSWMPSLNYFSWRVFVPTTGGFTNIFTYRRYFSQRPEYFYALFGYGSYSDEFIHLDADLNMTFIWQVGINKFLSQRWFFLAAFGATHDSGYQDRWMTQLGIRYYFNMFK